MGEVLRLFGLMEDGALIPYLVGGVVVWAALTVRGLRDHVDRLRKDHEKMGDTLDTVAKDVAFLRGQATPK
jgi:hypothetical protein